VREILRRNPRTGVRHSKPDKRPAISAPLFRRYLDQQPASLRHRVHRVDAHVQQRLPQQSRVAFDKIVAPIISGNFDPDTGLNGVGFDQFDDRGDQAGRLDRFAPQVERARQRE